MSICLLLIGDGRAAERERCIGSAKEMLPRLDRLVEIDDSSHELGFAGAIAEGWRQVRKTPAEFVFHLELDFTFHAEIPVDRIISVLKRHPELAQIVLKRQPWNEEEKTAGGIVEAHPDDFTQRSEGGDIWTEHRRFFSTNPSVYPAALCAQGWPQVPESEGHFTHRLLEDPKLRFALWGAKFDPPLVEHIGRERAGVGY